MGYFPRTGNMRSFIVRISLLTVLSVTGFMGSLAPEPPLWLQRSPALKWVVAIFCSLVIADILFWLPIVVPEGRMFIIRRLDWPEIKSKGKGQYMQEEMAMNLMRTLYFQPPIVLVFGRLWGWGIGKVLGTVSIFVFMVIFYSFFDVLRCWELNEKREKKSVQN
jgi:hypothetical protein